MQPLISFLRAAGESAYPHVDPKVAKSVEINMKTALERGSKGGWGLKTIRNVVALVERSLRSASQRSNA